MNAARCVPTPFKKHADNTDTPMTTDKLKISGHLQHQRNPCAITKKIINQNS